MNAKKQYSTNCPVCKEKLYSRSEQGLPKVLGYHKRIRHNIPGLTASREGVRFHSNITRMKKKGLSQAAAEKKAAELERLYQERLKLEQTNPSPKKKAEMQYMAIASCPFCDAAFFIQKPGASKLEPCKINYCPHCGKRFFAAG